MRPPARPGRPRAPFCELRAFHAALVHFRPRTSLTSAHPLRRFPRAGPLDDDSEMARVNKALEKVAEEREGVCAAIAGLLKREEGLMAPTPRTEDQALDLASVRAEKSNLRAKESMLLEKENKLLDDKSKLRDKESKLLDLALQATGACPPPPPIAAPPLLLNLPGSC